MTTHGQRFRRRGLRRGYKVDEVDAFLDRVEATIAGGPVDAPVTAQEVQDVVFRVRFGGYDEWQVDLHLDRVERQLAEAAEQDAGYGQMSDPRAAGQPTGAFPPPLPQRPSPTPAGQFATRQTGGQPSPYQEPGYGAYERDQAFSQDMTTEMRVGGPGGQGSPSPAPPAGAPGQGGPAAGWDAPTGAAPGWDGPSGGGAGWDAPTGAAPGWDGPSGGGAGWDAPSGAAQGRDSRGGQRWDGPTGAGPGWDAPTGAGPGWDSPSAGAPPAGQHPGMSAPPPPMGRPQHGTPYAGTGGQPEPPQDPPAGPPPGGQPGGPPPGGAGAPPPGVGGQPPPGMGGSGAGMPPELQRVDELRRGFQPRRFGSGYDRTQVDQLFAEVLAGMSGQAPMSVNETHLDPRRFDLVSGGYFEPEVDRALQEVRDILRRG